MSSVARAGAGQNCLHLFDVSATRAATELWLLHHEQWSLSHSTVTETFKVVTQLCDFLDQVLATLLRLKTAEAVSHALPRTWELLSKLASNIALLAHRDACEKLLKCIDVFVIESPELTVETRRKAHDWATRLLHGIAKVLDQINDLSRWQTDCGQSHYEMADLMRDPRQWVACDQSYVVTADREPRDLAYLLDTCLLFMHLQRPSGIVTHVLACVGKLPDITTPIVTAFLDQANSMLSKTSGCEDKFWSTVRARLWECHSVAFEAVVIRYAKCCIQEEQLITSSGSCPRDPLQELGLLQACAHSFLLCYRAVMMLRQLSITASGSYLADMPSRCFHLALKENMYALGDKAPFDLQCLYAGYLSEAAAIATVPVIVYRSADVLKSRLRQLAAATTCALLAASTQPTLIGCMADEIRSLFLEQCDWYWAAAMMSAVAASTAEMEHFLDIMVPVHAAATSPCSWSSEVLSNLQKQKSEIRSSLESAAMLGCLKGAAEPAKAATEESALDRARPPIIARYATVLDVILLLRSVLCGATQHVTDILCRLSPSSTVRLGIILHVLRMVEIEYWRDVGLLTIAGLQCLKAVLGWCMKIVAGGCSDARNADNAAHLQKILRSGEKYVDVLGHKLEQFTQHTLSDLDAGVTTVA